MEAVNLLSTICWITIENHALMGSRISDYKGMNQDECRNQCLSDPSCRSINYKSQAGEFDSKYTCQLNSAIAEDNQDRYRKTLSCAQYDKHMCEGEMCWISHPDMVFFAFYFDHFVVNNTDECKEACASRDDCKSINMLDSPFKGVLCELFESNSAEKPSKLRACSKNTYQEQSIC